MVAQFEGAKLLRGENSRSGNLGRGVVRNGALPRVASDNWLSVLRSNARDWFADVQSTSSACGSLAGC